MSRLIAILLLSVGLCACAIQPSIPPNWVSVEPIVSWNQQVLAAAESDDGFLTLKGLRTTALMHFAAHDALNTIEPRYSPYQLHQSDPTANPTAAMTQAMFVVAMSQYPDQAKRWSAERDQWLASVPSGAARQRGIALGEAAAKTVLGHREDDRWNDEAEYQWHPMAPGVYAEFREHSATPEGFIFGAGWAGAEPFALPRPDFFRVEPPPVIDSAEYARAFNEVRVVGRQVSPERTADQTHLALWWKDFVENSHNRLARRLVIEQGLDAMDANRLFALLNAAVFDAYVSSFENKFHYNHWRPYTAIRWAANDNNSATQAEPDWTNTHNHTYAFPSYPSAHGTACAAAMTVMADTFGDRFTFTMHTPQVDIAGPFSGKRAMNPPTRTFDRFSAAAKECAISRIYLGIHFRYDSIEGNRLGNRVGDQVVKALLRRASAP